MCKGCGIRTGARKIVTLTHRCDLIYSANQLVRLGPATHFGGNVNSLSFCTVWSLKIAACRFPPPSARYETRIRAGYNFSMFDALMQQQKYVVNAAQFFVVYCCAVATVYAQTPVQPGLPGRVTAEQQLKHHTECRDAYRAQSIRDGQPFSEAAMSESCALVRLACAVGAIASDCDSAMRGILQSLGPRRK